MRRMLAVKGLLLLLLVGPAAAPADEPALSATEVIRRMELQTRGESSQGELDLEIVSPSFQRRLGIRFWTQGNEKALVRVTAPSKEAGIGWLRLGDLMWNYFPKVERTIKIPPSVMMQPWNGSDFTNDDMMKASSFVTDYRHRLLQTRPDSDGYRWEIECVPRPDRPVVWGKLVFRVKADFLPVRQEFYDERGQLVKSLVFSDVRKVGERPFPHTWTMTNLKKPGCRTVIRYREVAFDRTLPEDTFSLRRLSR